MLHPQFLLIDETHSSPEDETLREDEDVVVVFFYSATELYLIGGEISSLTFTSPPSSLL